MKKNLIIGILGLVLMTSMVSAYTAYKFVETSYLTVSEEAVINKLMIERILIMPPNSDARFDGTVHINLRDGELCVEDQRLVICEVSKR